SGRRPRALPRTTAPPALAAWRSVPAGTCSRVVRPVEMTTFPLHLTTPARLFSTTPFKKRFRCSWIWAAKVFSMNDSLYAGLNGGYFYRNLQQQPIPPALPGSRFRAAWSTVGHRGGGQCLHGRYRGDSGRV